MAPVYTPAIGSGSDSRSGLVFRHLQPAISAEPSIDPIPAPPRDGPRISPSFLIRGAASPSSAPTGAGAGAFSHPAQGLRLDRINSAEVLRLARGIYFSFLATGPCALEPAGIVLDGHGSGGRVVFDLPVLLPEEQFVPIDWVRARSSGRSRAGRPPAGRPPL